MTHAVPASGGSKGHTSEMIYIEKSVISAVIRRDETIEKGQATSSALQPCGEPGRLLNSLLRPWPRGTSKPLSH
jgi:hypothetical protein